MAARELELPGILDAGVFAVAKQEAPLALRLEQSPLARSHTCPEFVCGVSGPEFGDAERGDSTDSDAEYDSVVFAFDEELVGTPSEAVGEDGFQTFDHGSQEAVGLSELFFLPCA